MDNEKQQEIRTMGILFNPGNDGYTQIKNSQIYVDKTWLIDFLNKRLSTEDKFIALSHARQFGKSHAAKIIDAYYSRGCDSSTSLKALILPEFLTISSI